MSSDCHRPAGNVGSPAGLCRAMSIKTLSTTPLIHPTAEVRDSRLGAYTEVGARTRLLEVALGDYSYIVNDSEAAYTTVGKFCSIAAMARINPGNHPMGRATQSHITYRASAYVAGAQDEEEFSAWRRASLGTGAVVGAGAVVTKDVDPYAIVAGNPARVMRQRFPAGVARRLQRLAWWDWDHERLRAALPDFRRLSIERFLKKYELTSLQKPKRSTSQMPRSKTRQSTYRPGQSARS